MGCRACPTNDWRRERFAARELLDMAPEDPVESPEVHLGRRHSAVQKWARLSDLGCREHYSWFETPIPWLKSRSGLTFSSFRPIVTSSAPCRDYLATTSLGAATACCTARRTIPSDQLVTRSNLPGRLDALARVGRAEEAETRSPTGRRLARECVYGAKTEQSASRSVPIHS